MADADHERSFTPQRLRRKPAELSTSAWVLDAPPDLGRTVRGPISHLRDEAPAEEGASHTKIRPYQHALPGARPSDYRTSRRNCKDVIRSLPAG